MKFLAFLFTMALAGAALAQTSHDFVLKLKQSAEPGNVLLEIQKSNPQDRVVSILKTAWPDLNNKQKGDLLRVVTWAKSPYSLQVIAWVIDDTDRKLQNDGLNQLERLIGNQLIFDYKRARKWLQTNALKSLLQAQSDVARELFRQLTTQKERDLMLTVSYLSRCDAFVAEAKTWSEAERNRIFEIVLSLAIQSKGSPAEIQDYKGLAAHIDLSAEYIRTTLIPRWYQSTNRAESSILLEAVCNRKEADFGNEIFEMLKYNLTHVEDTSKQDCIFLYDLFYRNHPDLRVAKLIFDSSHLPPQWKAEIYGYILPTVTGISTFPQPADEWWKTWYQSNQARLANAHLSKASSNDQGDLANRNILPSFVGKGDGWVEKATTLWPSLTMGAKASVLQRLQTVSMNVQGPILKLALNDSDFYIQNLALSMISAEARTFFVSLDEAQKWLNEQKGKSYVQVETDSIHSFLAEILAQKDSDVIPFISSRATFNNPTSMKKYASREQGTLVYEKLWNQIARGEDSSGTAKSFLESCPADPATLEKFAVAGLKDPSQKEVYRAAVMVATHSQESWGKDLILKQFQALSVDPNGPISNFLTELTLVIDIQSDIRLVPYLVRLIMLRPNEDRYYLDYYGLHRLTGVPYDKLHDQRWWKQWWTENAPKFPQAAGVEIPEPQESEPRLTPLNPSGTFDEIAASFVKAAKAGDLADIGMRDSYVQALQQSDLDRAIPYLIAALKSYGDEFSYDFGYFHISKAVSVPYFSAQDAQWWVEFWKRNADRFPTATAKLPNLEVEIAEKPNARNVPVGVKASVNPIRSIRLEDTDFSDLECLRTAIGDAQIVQLGEPSHRDGATFMAKARVIRYLHEKLGFDVLVWESGMFDCDQMNAELEAGKDWSNAMELGIFPIWNVTPPVKKLFEYAASTYQTKRPLEMTGVDPQFSGQANKNFESFVREFFVKGSIPLDSNIDARLAKAVALVQGNGGSVDNAVATFAVLGERVQQNRSELGRIHGTEKVDRMLRYLGNAQILAEMQNASSGVDSNNPRDKRMGDNLSWLANGPYKNKKMIVWAASFHLMRNPSKIDTRLESLNYSHLRDMGDWAYEALGKRIYTIAFIAHHGWIGNPFFGSSLLPSAPKGSIEQWLHDVGHPYSFVDLRKLPAGSLFAQDQLAGPLGYSFMKAKWPNIFDGFFFTDEMFSSSRETLPRADRH